MIYAEVLHVFSSTWMLGIISDHQARPLTREEVAMAADRLNKPAASAIPDAAGPEATDASDNSELWKAADQCMRKWQWRPNAEVLAQFHHDFALAVEDQAKVLIRNLETLRQENLNFRNRIDAADAAEVELRDTAYRAMIGQRDAIRAQLAAKTAEVETVQGLMNKLETMAREAGITINAVEGTCLIDFERGGYPTITTDSLADAIAQTKGKTP